MGLVGFYGLWVVEPEIEPKLEILSLTDPHPTLLGSQICLWVFGSDWVGWVGRVWWVDGQPYKLEKKRWRINKWGHLAIWCRRVKRSPGVWGLMQFWRTTWVRTSKREEKNRESKRKLWVIHNEEESSEWKEKVSVFFVQIVSLSVVISI